MVGREIERHRRFARTAHGIYVRFMVTTTRRCNIAAHSERLPPKEELKENDDGTERPPPETRGSLYPRDGRAIARSPRRKFRGSGGNQGRGCAERRAGAGRSLEVDVNRGKGTVR